MREMKKLQAVVRSFQWLGIWMVFSVLGGGISLGAQFSIDEHGVSPGEVVPVGIRVADFTEVQAVQFSLSWDPEVLQVGGFSDFGLVGLGANSFGVFQALGRLSVIWDSSTLEGETLADGSILFQVEFLALGEEGHSSLIEFSDTPTQRLIVQDLAQGVFESNAGTVSIGQPPVILGPSTVTFSEDQNSGPISLTFSDDSTSATDLLVTFVSLNEALVPTSGLRLEGDGASRNLFLEALENQSGELEIQIRAEDENGAVGMLTIVVTVLAINDPPMAVNDVLRVLEDSGEISVDVLSNDSSLPDTGEELILDSVEAPSAGGTVHIEAGQLRYAPALNFFGVEEVLYRIRDNAGLTDVATLTVTVDPVNDPPTAIDDMVVMDEDGEEIRVLVLTNDSDFPDSGEVLSVASISVAAIGGGAELRDGIVFYQPFPNFFGEDSFRYTVDDGSGNVSDASVFVEVVSINDPPLAVDDGVSVPEDSSGVFVDVLGNDSFAPDLNETLSIESVSQGSSGGIVDIDASGLRYTSPPNFFGIENFEYTISDGNEGVASALVTVTVVNDRADAPVARDDRFMIPEDSDASLLLALEDNGNGRDFDPDGDSLTIVEVNRLDASPGSIEIDATRTGLVYTPAQDFVGSETFSYVVTDGERLGTGFVFVVVSDANNDPPLAFDDLLEVPEDSEANRLDVLADNGFGADSDPEGDTLSVLLVPGFSPANGSLEVASDGTALIYTPDPDFSGIERFPYRVSDGTGESRGNVELTVVNVDNDPPRARDDQIVVAEDLEDQILDVLKENGFGPDSDPEGDSLVVVDVEMNEDTHGSVRVSDGGGFVLYSPRSNFVGNDSFRYTITDGTFESSAAVSIVVENRDNDPPEPGNDQFVIIEDEGVIELDVLEDNGGGPDLDPEGDRLVLVGVSSESPGSASLMLNEDRTAILYESSPDFFGVDQFTYRVSDGVNVSEGNVSVIVTRGENDAPLARDDVFSVVEDSGVTQLSVIGSEGGGEDTDPDGDSLRIVAAHGPGSHGGAVGIAQGGLALTYKPQPDFSGEETFAYTVSDGALTSSASVRVNVTPVADPPQITTSSNLVFDQGSGVIILPIEIEDIDTPIEALSVRVLSENLTLLPQDRIQINLIEGIWTASLDPVPTESGTVDLRLIVSDGEHESLGSVLLSIEPIVVIEGITAGGYLGRGRVFVDMNNDGIQGESEPGGDIGRDGRYRFTAVASSVDRDKDGVVSANDGHLVVRDGFDYLSGALLGYEMRGPLGSSVLSPFSSMVSAAIDSGLILGADAAIGKVRSLLGINDETLTIDGFLHFSPAAMGGGSEESDLRILRKMASLDAMVSHASSLYSVLTNASVGMISREIFLSLVSQEQELFFDCAPVQLILNQLNSSQISGLDSDVLEFVQRVICSHLERISAADSSRLGQLRVFSEIQILHDVRTIADENSVTDALMLRYLDSAVDTQIEAYPFFNILNGLDHPGTLRFLYPNASVIEGGGTVSRTFVVRDGGSLGALDAAALLLGRTATQSSDFLLQPQIIEFSEGQIVQELDLSSIILDDTLLEGEELAELRLFFGDETDEAGVALIRDTTLLSILDDDYQGLFEFEAPTFAGVEDENEPVVFIKRGGGIKGEASVLVRLVKANVVSAADEGVDYHDELIKVHFSAGELIKGVSLPVIPDLRVEPDEVIVLELLPDTESEAGAAAIGPQSRAVYSILNDDFDRVPTIAEMPQQMVNEDASLVIPLVISDDETPVEFLQVEAVSRDVSLILVESVTFDSIGSRFLLSVGTVPNAAGTGSVRISISDGNQTSVHDLFIQVKPINDSPLISLAGENQVLFVEDEDPVPLVPSVALDELDGDLLVGARVSFTAGFRSLEDRLIFGGGGGDIEGDFDRDTGVLSLRGESSTTEYERALQRVLYDNRSDNPTTLSRVVSITVSDGVSMSEPVDVVIVLQAVNDQPLLGRLESDPLVYVENSEPLSVSETVLVVTADDQFFTQARVQIRGNYVKGEDILLVGDLPGSLSVSGFDPDSGRIRITGRGTLSEYQAVLRSVRYHNLSDAPTLFDRLVEFSITDADLESEPKNRSIRIVPIDDLPVFNGPGNLTVVTGEEVSARFNVTDPDSAVELPLVSVESANPSLITGTSVEVLRVGDEFEVRFRARSGHVGEADFTLTLGDGDRVVSESFRVTVLPATNAPSVIGPDVLVLMEDNAGDLDLTMVDEDDISLALEVSFQVDNIDLFPPGSIILERDLFDLKFQLTPAKNAFGRTRLSVFVSDASTTVEHRVEIDVVPENDLPTVEGVRNTTIDPGEAVEFDLVLGDAESPIDQLLLGVRPLDPRMSEQVTFSISTQGDRRAMSLLLDSSLRGVVAFELVVVDAQGGSNAYPFEVRIRESEFRPESLQILRLETGMIELSWIGPGRVAIARDIEGPYLPIDGSVSPFQLRTQEEMEYFKLVD